VKFEHQKLPINKMADQRKSITIQ